MSGRAVDVLLALSNLVFVAPALRAYRWGHGLRAAVYLLAMGGSTWYHLCDSYGASCCTFGYYYHVSADFIFAQLAIPLSTLYLIRFPWPHVELWLIIAYGLAIATLVSCYPGGNFWVQSTVLGASLVPLAVYLVVFRCRRGRWPRYHLDSLLVAVAFSGVGVLLFVAQSVLPPWYWSMHSLWHVMVAIGQFYWIGVRDPVPHYLNMASKVY